MNRLRIMLSAAFILVFAAGGTAGLMLGGARPKSRGPDHFLARELSLTEEQRVQMREIWREALHELHRKHRERREQLRAARDEAIYGIFTPDQQERYRLVQGDYHRGLEELARERNAAVETAVKRTKAILTPQQVEVYERMRPKHPSGKHPGSNPPDEF